MCWVGMLISITEVFLCQAPQFSRDQGTGRAGHFLYRTSTKSDTPAPRLPAQPSPRVSSARRPTPDTWITNSSTSNNLTPNQNAAMLAP
jgi:hypothetical protein